MGRESEISTPAGRQSLTLCAGSWFCWRGRQCRHGRKGKLEFTTAIYNDFEMRRSAVSERRETHNINPRGKTRLEAILIVFVPISVTGNRQAPVLIIFHREQQFRVLRQIARAHRE